MTSKHKLENYYKGDDAWKAFVMNFEQNWLKCDYQEELVRDLGGQEDIAVVIFATVNDKCRTWIHQPIPALDGLSPQECVKSQMLLKRLRTMLMRMPR